jgi:hypothetical protein
MNLRVYGMGILRAYAAVATEESVPFLSWCTGCGHLRLQLGYSLDGLLCRLDAEMPISAYCLACDLVWSINSRERAVITRGLDPVRSVPRR